MARQPSATIASDGTAHCSCGCTDRDSAALYDTHYYANGVTISYKREPYFDYDTYLGARASGCTERDAIAAALAD